MYKLLFLLLSLSPLVADVCVAQANAITIMCEDCRDPHDYPDDFVNFAFNQVYGPDAWLTFEQADDFFITNLDGQKVYVDVDFVSLGLGYKGFGIPFWPTNILQFTLALPDGTLLKALRSIFQTSLPVPSSPVEPPIDESSDSSDDNDEEDEEDFYAENEEWEEWEEPEIDEYEGFTTIEDPDEYGNFDDDDWCEEC